MAVKVQFSNHEFVNSHGKSPKGEGAWAFQVTHVDGFSGPAPVVFAPLLTLSNARKWMKVQVANWLPTVGLENARTVEVNVLP